MAQALKYAKVECQYDPVLFENVKSDIEQYFQEQDPTKTYAQHNMVRRAKQGVKAAFRKLKNDRTD